MPRIIPPGFAEARFVQRAQGDPDPWICTIGVSTVDAGGDYFGLATTLAYAWVNQMLPNQSNIVTLESVDLIIGQDGEDPLIYSYASGATGAGSGNYLPQNTALLVQKRTDSGGRRNRGRMYVPLILGESAVDNVGVIQSSQVTALNASMETFLDILNTGGTGDFPAAPPYILHSDETGTPPPPTLITSLQVSNVIATQRRRLR